MIAAIYARKSTEQNGVGEEGKSVTRQIEHAREYAAKKGWTVAEEHIYVDDGVSGAEFVKRPGLVRLLNALKPRPPFQALVMSEESRLGREQIATASVLKEISEAGVRVFYHLEDREARLDDATGKFLEAVRHFAAEMEREKARQRTRDAMLRKAKAAHVTGGRVFGYDNVEQRCPEGKRLHVRRVINQAEAEVVSRIFDSCAKGWGFRRIAHDLNAARLPAPRPSKAGPRGWSPSTVRDVVHRQLYRGLIVWNRTQKRDAWGHKRPQRRKEHEWLRVPVPELRIVSDELWQAAHDRLHSSRETYLRSTDGRLWGKPSNGIESKYLLTGMAVCGRCGGALTARSRSHGRHRGLFYQCLVNVQRGRSVCDNDLAVPLKDTEKAVLGIVEDDVLRPEVVDAALREAVAKLEAPGADRAVEHGRVQAVLARVETELARLTEALVSGGPLPSIVAAIKEREEHRSRAQQDLEALEQLEQMRGLDRSRLARELRTKLADWRGLLSRNVAQARQVLRSLVPDRLTFMPKDEGGERFYIFEGRAVLDRVLAGIALPKAGLAPTGFEPVFSD
jgi:site-specific DNA recombinase